MKVIWDTFIKNSPEGFIKAILILIGQIISTIFIYLTENTIATIIISVADLMFILLVVYNKVRKDLKEDFKERLKEKEATISEKNITIESLHKSLGIKKKSSDLGDPLNK